MSNLEKNIKNGRLLKKNGSWMYCDKCNKTVGYLCYTTYQDFSFKFLCECGNSGVFELKYNTDKTISKASKSLVNKKNRLCCPNDDAPLFSIIESHLEKYSYSITCNKCYSKYEKE